MSESGGARKCEDYHNRGWTCTKHKAISKFEKYSFATLGGVGALLVQGLMTKAVYKLLIDLTQNPMGAPIQGLLLLILLVTGVMLVGRLEETHAWKYVAAGAAAPFIVLNALFAPVVRAAFG